VKDADDPSKDQRWIFVRSKAAGFYDASVSAMDQKAAFIARARLVSIGSVLFVDFAGDFDRLIPGDKLENPMPLPAIATHGIGRIWIEKDSLRIHFLSDSWAKQQMTSGTLALAHLNVDGNALITATTEELRKFMVAHAEDADALSETYELKRVK
jgi:hypothetical protein